MDISVIIVSWNVTDLLRDCLRSLFESRLGGHSLEVIVVDSASSDGTTTMVEHGFPQARLIAQTENVGFTRGNNIGLAAAQGRYLLLLNPDTVVLDDALAQMADFLDSNPQVGVVGPHTLNSDGTHQPSRRRFPTRRTAIFEIPWLQSFAPKSLLDTYTVSDQPDDGVYEVDWVQGSCMMLRREVYEQIGGLDEGYVMFFEELDWCKRAKAAGWRVAYIGTAKIIHHGGKSTEQVSARKHIHYNESKLRYFRKVYGRGFALLLRLVLLATYGWQLATEWLKGVFGSQRPLRRERVATYWQVLRSGLRVR